jgi:Prolyl oligopeptidase, N-terminal beta-propeller domain
VSLSGSDWYTIHIKDVDTGLDLPDKIEWCKFSSVAWNKVLTYSHSVTVCLSVLVAAAAVSLVQVFVAVATWWMCAAVLEWQIAMHCVTGGSGIAALPKSAACYTQAVCCS